jgi:hypothetical protein
VCFFNVSHSLPHWDRTLRKNGLSRVSCLLLWTLIISSREDFLVDTDCEEGGKKDDSHTPQSSKDQMSVTEMKVTNDLLIK